MNNYVLFISLIIYIIFVLFILTYKPKILYCEDKFKLTGCGSKDKTIFSLPVILITSSILIYFTILNIFIIKKNL